MRPCDHFQRSHHQQLGDQPFLTALALAGRMSESAPGASQVPTTINTTVTINGSTPLVRVPVSVNPASSTVTVMPLGRNIQSQLQLQKHLLDQLKKAGVSLVPSTPTCAQRSAAQPQKSAAQPPLKSATRTQPMRSSIGSPVSPVLPLRSLMGSPVQPVGNPMASAVQPPRPSRIRFRS